MSQPVWKYAGHVGDVDPISYGGGFIYTDETGVYAPEVTWFEPAPDEEWHKTDGNPNLEVYRFILEHDSTQEWWYSKLADIASFTGLSVEELQASANGTTMGRAQLYSDLIHYYGAHEFDSYPETITEDAAREKYAEELRQTNRPRIAL